MENEEDEQISRILRLSYVEKASFTTLGSATILGTRQARLTMTAELCGPRHTGPRRNIRCGRIPHSSKEYCKRVLSHAAQRGVDSCGGIVGYIVGCLSTGMLGASRESSYLSNHCAPSKQRR